MPNQLSADKRRHSVTEHKAVFAAIAEIARISGVGVVDVLRDAIRTKIKELATDPEYACLLRAAAARHAPSTPNHFSSRAELARYKRACRNFDQLLMELNLQEPYYQEKRNSIVNPDRPLKVAEFGERYGK